MKIENFVREDLLTLEKYTSARGESGDFNGLFLDANESPYGEYRKYPDPQQRALKAALSVIKKVDPSDVILTNGSDELIDLCLRLTCQTGDKVLQLAPTYGMYDVSAKINGLQMTSFQTGMQGEIDWDKFDSILQANDFKVLFVCAPNNPIGYDLSIDALEKLVQKFNGLVFIDEAYIEFSERESAMKLCNRYNNVVISQTLSKAFGMAGLRIGIGIANQSIIELLNAIKPPYNLSSVVQQIALAELNRWPLLVTRIDIIKKEREKLIRNLQDIPAVTRTYPSQTNFILVEFTNPQLVIQILKDKGILVRDRSKQIPNTLRISIGKPIENKLVIDILKNINP